MTVAELARKQHFIGGNWVDAIEGGWFTTYNPATGEGLAEVARGTAPDIDRAVAAARTAFQTWACTDGVARGRILYRFAAAIHENRETLACLETLDNGKPLRQARADVDVAVRYFEFYASLADKLSGRTVPIPGPFFDYTVREPLGVCAEIVPWNYPLQISSRGIAAALAGGNTMILKPAEETPLTALELARLGHQAALPPGTLNVVCGYGEEAGAALSSHPGIHHITFTGSVEVGSRVMEAAAHNVVPVLLELGGKSPNVVFSSADLGRAIPIICNSIIQNAGQTCSAGSRLLVDETLHEEVVQRLIHHFSSISLGSGIDDPDLGPVVSAQQCDRVRGYLDLARAEGVAVYQADTHTTLPTGNFVPPTILDDVPVGSRVFHEEIFGPVVAVSIFKDEDEAVQLANGTEYGLVAAIWSNNVAQAHRVASRIRAGQIFINSYGAGGGVEMPFGGYGKSGFGRVKGVEALDHYTQIKNVCVYTGME